MINMLRLKISNFIRNHKDKIKDLGQKLLMVAMGVFIATIILSSMSGGENEKDQNEIANEIANVYKPTQTVIQGSDVSKEQYEEDKNLVNTFLEFCNNGKVEDAYNLISDECKQESYPTIEQFKKYYYDNILQTEQ